jgi:hypothetical protein
MPSRLADGSDGSQGEDPSIALPLQSAGLLSALIFLINSIFEVLVINQLYESQYVLIALLLAVLSLWAFLEVALIGRRAAIPPLRILKLLLASQIVLILIRHVGERADGKAGKRPSDYEVNPILFATGVHKAARRGARALREDRSLPAGSHRPDARQRVRGDPAHA